jgi:hypothetical protein
VVTLFYHFVKIEAMRSDFFDWAVRLIGSGAPRLVLPVHSTRLIKRRLQRGWTLAKTLRLGMDGSRLFIDFLFEKERPALREAGRVVGMDSNYKNGLVFSDGQVLGLALYQRIQEFAKRQRNTHAEIKSLLGQALKQVDFAAFKTLCIEDLKGVKSGIRGTFSRQLESGGCLIGFMPLSHGGWSSIVRKTGLSWNRKIPIKPRNTAGPVLNGTGETAGAIGLSAYIVATLPMPITMPRTTWSSWGWRESMVSVYSKAKGVVYNGKVFSNHIMPQH